MLGVECVQDCLQLPGCFINKEYWADYGSCEEGGEGGDQGGWLGVRQGGARHRGYREQENTQALKKNHLTFWTLSPSENF